MTAVISIERVTKRFPGVTALCDVDLEIRFDMPYSRHLPKGMRGMLPKGQNPPKALAQYAL